jgi:hypothetical protein
LINFTERTVLPPGARSPFPGSELGRSLLQVARDALGEVGVLLEHVEPEPQCLDPREFEVLGGRIAAIMGFGTVAGKMAGCRSCGRVSVAPVEIPDSAPESMPGQNVLPAPVTTIARTPGSAVHRRSSAKYSSSMGTDQEFRRSGRFQVRTATPSSMSQVTSSPALDWTSTVASSYSLSVR